MKKILIIEDNPFHIKTMKRLHKITKSNTELIFVGSHYVGIKEYNDNKKDIVAVIVDYKIEFGTGVDFMNGIDNDPNIKFYANSTEEDNNMKLKKVGCHFVLEKNKDKIMAVFINPDDTPIF